MDHNFSTIDRLRAITCCLPTCTLLPASPSTETLNEINNNGEEDNRAWYAQSRPSASSSSHEASLPGNWEDADFQQRRREADLMSLHESREAAYTPPRWRGGRGGDISGGGATAGSGLSRLTLLKTLWRGWWKGQGAVRLEESDDEVEAGDEGYGEDEDGRAGARQEFEDDPARRALSVSHGGGDALPLEVTPEGGIIFSPPASVTTAGGGEDEGAESREERRARRLARRRARELGLSVEQFDQGSPAEPSEMDVTSPALSLPTSSSSRSKRGRSRRAEGGSSKSGSEVSAPTQMILVDASSAQDTASRSSREFNFGKSLHAPLQPPRSAASASSSTSSSSHSRSRSSATQLSSASQIPLPSSPATSGGSRTFLEEPTKSSRRSHRSHPSLSSTSTSSSYQQSKSKRSKKHRPTTTLADQQEELPESTAFSSEYYTDENGQLQPSPYTPPGEGQWYVDERTGQHHFVPVVSPFSQQYQQQPSYFSAPLPPPEATNYDHIGFLPTSSSSPNTIMDPLAASPEPVKVKEALAPLLIHNSASLGSAGSREEEEEVIKTPSSPVKKQVVVVNNGPVEIQDEQVGEVDVWA